MASPKITEQDIKLIRVLLSLKFTPEQISKLLDLGAPTVRRISGSKLIQKKIKLFDYNDYK